MEVGIKVLRSFDMVYRQLGKHRKKCPSCGKLIQDGQRVTATETKTTKYYPVKGLMSFVKWRFEHIDFDDCEGTDRDRAYCPHCDKMVKVYWRGEALMCNECRHCIAM